MKVGSIRKLEELKSVLKDTHAIGPDPVYWVFSELSDLNWANMTVIAPGSYSGEYPKTFGHYHPEDAADETYHLVEGEGVLMIQKKHTENGVWVPDMVDEVYLIKAKPGDEIIIKPQWGHAWSNTGKGPFVSYDNWRSGHTKADYEAIEKLQGLAYYLVEENGEPKPVPNPNYKNLPEVVWITEEQFQGGVFYKH
ncbi:hypothetical protein HYW46_02150 [Candidatus Daviesbacteria bacterium]|nr:hypothetical protein [Candidatus Daviesbacteria bacterium]